MSQQLGLPLADLRESTLQRPGDASMVMLLCAPQQRLVGNFLDQRVLEGVFDLGEKARFVQKLRREQMSEMSRELVVRALGDRLQESQGDLLADDRRHLQYRFRIRRETVDACG